MPTPSRRRMIGTMIAAATLTVGLVSGCTAGDWRYEAPSGVGVARDSGPVKARNILVVADDEGTGVLLGSLFASQPIELTGAAIEGQLSDGGRGPAVTLDVSGAIPTNGALNLQTEKVVAKGAKLEPGQLATVALQFSDGTQLVLETPVMSAEHEDYTTAFEQAIG